MKATDQTWWDKDIKDQFGSFQVWVGKSNAKSKQYMRDYIKKGNFTSLIDVGCGMCDDFFAYQRENPELDWQGVDSSQFLTTRHYDKKIPVVNQKAHDMKFDDNSFDVAYSRHVLEHQRYYQPILAEMIRVASKMVTHIFFIPPRDKEIIHYNEETNLYHNTFNKSEIENWLYKHNNVKVVQWIPLGTEEILIIDL